MDTQSTPTGPHLQGHAQPEQSGHSLGIAPPMQGSYILTPFNPYPGTLPWPPPWLKALGDVLHQKFQRFMESCATNGLPLTLVEVASRLTENRNPLDTIDPTQYNALHITNLPQPFQPTYLAGTLTAAYEAYVRAVSSERIPLRAADLLLRLVSGRDLSAEFQLTDMPQRQNNMIAVPALAPVPISSAAPPMMPSGGGDRAGLGGASHGGDAGAEVTPHQAPVPSGRTGPLKRPHDFDPLEIPVGADHPSGADLGGAAASAQERDRSLPPGSVAPPLSMSPSKRGRGRGCGRPRGRGRGSARGLTRAAAADRTTVTPTASTSTGSGNNSPEDMYADQTVAQASQGPTQQDSDTERDEAMRAEAASYGMNITIIKRMDTRVDGDAVDKGSESEADSDIASDKLRAVGPKTNSRGRPSAGRTNYFADYE